MERERNHGEFPARRPQLSQRAEAPTTPKRTPKPPNEPRLSEAGVATGGKGASQAPTHNDLGGDAPLDLLLKSPISNAVQTINPKLEFNLHSA